jgi:predicted component of type VI protein secretion system
MTDDEMIHWENGLFIEPQHFQAMQRQNVRRAVAERRMLTPFPYGVVEAELDQQALTLSGASKVSFKRLHVVTESGLVVHKGHNATVADLDFKDVRGGGQYTIYLVVRSWEGTGQAVRETDGLTASADAGVTVTRYQRQWREVVDENTGTDTTRVSTRVLDARLVAVGEGDQWPDKNVWESLPVARIIAGNPPRPSREYAPPCMRLSGSDELRGVVGYIEQQAAATLSDMAANLRLPDQNQSKSDVSELLKYQALLMHRAALSHAMLSETLSAYEAYGLCLKLLAAVLGTEVAAYDLTSKYKHEDPWPPFWDLWERFKTATERGPEPARYCDLTPKPDNQSLHTCTVDTALVAQGWSCMLAVGGESADDLRLVIEQLGNIQIGNPAALLYNRRDLQLEYDRQPSTEVLPAINQPGGATRFYRLLINQNANGWIEVTKSRQIGVKYTDQSVGGRRVRLRFRLYLIPPARA